MLFSPLHPHSLEDRTQGRVDLSAMPAAVRRLRKGIHRTEKGSPTVRSLIEERQQKFCNLRILSYTVLEKLPQKMS